VSGEPRIVLVADAAETMAELIEHLADVDRAGLSDWALIGGTGGYGPPRRRTPTHGRYRHAFAINGAAGQGHAATNRVGRDEHRCPTVRRHDDRHY
jgi:hypothetical protein